MRAGGREERQKESERERKGSGLEGRAREEGGERGGGLGRVKGGRRRAGHGGPSGDETDSSSDFFRGSR